MMTPADPGELLVYVGTHTRGGSKGIYLGRFNLAEGKLQLAGLAAELTNPTFLALHPSRPLLYSVCEIVLPSGDKTGAVTALAVNPQTGGLTLLNQQSSRGINPCHLVIDHNGKFVLVANYASGSVACLPIQPDGRLGEATSFIQHAGSSVNRQRQDGPHAHGIALDAAERFALVADLGLDKIMVYRLDHATGKLTGNCPASVSMAAGAGPRHIAFHPDGRFAYVINELDSTVTIFDYDAIRGVLRPLETLSTLPASFHGENTAAEIAVHPSGKFLYGSNRGHQSIVAFAIDSGTGKLNCLGHKSTRGASPRNFSINTSGVYLLAANEESENVVVFRIDQQSGKLHPTGNEEGAAADVHRNGAALSQEAEICGSAGIFGRRKANGTTRISSTVGGI